MKNGNIDFSLTTLSLNSLLDINNNEYKNYLNNDSLIFNINPEYTYSYLYSNILYIDDNKNIVPLSYNILNKQSAFSINDSYQYNINIDNSTIIEKDKVLIGSYEHIPIARNNFQGRFSYDINSLSTKTKIIDNYAKRLLTINDNIISKIEKLDDFIDPAYILYKFDYYNSYLYKYEYFNKKYSQSIFIHQNPDDSFSILELNINNILYKDNKKIKEIKNEQLCIIDNDIFEFDIILSFDYQYESTRNMDYIYYNNLIDDFISTNLSINSNVIKYDKDKSFIFDIKKNNFEYNKKTYNIIISTQVKYLMHFNIINNFIQNININISDLFTFSLNKFQKINSLDKIGEILYYDNYNGFNFTENGNPIGVCLYPRNYFSNENQIIHKDYNEYYNNNENPEIQYTYTYSTSLIKPSNNIINYRKPIYIKLDNNRKIETININNINNYLANIKTINNIITYYYKNETSNTTNYIIDYDSGSKELKNNTYYNVELNIEPYYINNEYLDDNIYTLNNLYKSWKPTTDNITYISPYITNINNLFRYFNYSANNNINHIYDLEYNNIINQTNSQYNNDDILGYNNIYLPSLYDLLVFNGFRFNYLLDKNIDKIDSKIFYKENDIYYNYSIENNKIIKTEISSETNINDINTILLFTIPDINILYSDQYYIMYDNIKKYYIVDYLINTTNIILNIQLFGISLNAVLNKNFIFKLNYKHNNKDYEYIINTNNYSDINSSNIIEINKDNFISENKLSFNVYNYTTNENIIIIYYQDSNNNLNTEFFEEEKYKILCEIHLKK